MTEVTRADLTALSQRIDQRMDWLDAHGTRGVGTLQVQVTELAKDLGRIEQAQEAHVRLHEQEARDRASTRRWLVASVIIPTVSCVIAGTGVLIAVLAVH
jgi:hypothetical protein